MNMYIREWKGRIATLVHDYSYELESIRCEDFPSSHLQIAVKHIFDKLKPSRLQTVIQHEFVVRDADNLEEKDFFKFIDVLMRKAAVFSESIRSAPTDTGAGEVQKRFKDLSERNYALWEVQPSSPKAQFNHC